MEKNKFYQKENGKGISYILMILMSLLCVVIAGLLLFVPAIEVSTVCYTFCTGFILWGILHISKFFLSHAYRKRNDYSFSMGVLLIVLGCCGMIRMDAIIAKKDICFGMITLCMGILTLQSAIQLKHAVERKRHAEGTIQLNALQNKYWMWDMAAAFVLILCSVFVITDTTILVHNIPAFSEWVLFVAGLISVFNIIFVTRLINIKTAMEHSVTCQENVHEKGRLSLEDDRHKE